MDNRKEDQQLVIQYAESSALLTGIDETNRIRLVANGSEGFLFINEAYEGRLDLSSRLGAGLSAICTSMVYGFGSDGNIIEVEAVRLWEVQ